MSTDVFLGGLASLFMAAVLIVALTSSRWQGYSGTSREDKESTNDKKGS